MEQALQDLRITSSILQRKYNDLESEKKKLEKDMEEFLPIYENLLPTGISFLNGCRKQ